MKYIIFYDETPVAEVVGDNVTIKLLDLEGLNYKKVK